MERGSFEAFLNHNFDSIDLPSPPPLPPLHEEGLLNFQDVGGLSDFISSFSLTSIIQDPRDYDRMYRQSVLEKLGNTVIYLADIKNHKDIAGDAISSVIPLMHSVNMSNFKSYISVHGELLELFDENHKNSRQMLSRNEKHKKDVLLADSDLANCFENVPPFFFTENLCLEDAATFDKATTGVWSLEALEILQGYLDLVEVALMKQIFAKSDAFFDTPNKLEELKKDIVGALTQIHSVTRTLHAITKNVIAPTLSITQRKRRLKNISDIHSFTTSIVNIKTTAASIQTYLSVNDFLRAMKALQSTRDMITGDLQNVKCLIPTIKQLKDYETLITSTMASKFEAIALNFNFHEAGCGDSESDDAILASQLYPLAQGLVQAGTLLIMLVSYKERIKSEISAIVKTVVSTEIGVGKNANGTQYSDALKSMNSKDFLSLLECVFEHLLLITHRVYRVNAILLGCLGVETIVTSSRDDEDDSREISKERDIDSKNPLDVVEETHEVLKLTCILAQKHVIRLLDVRLELHIKYSIAELHKIWELALHFTNQTEKHAGKRVKKLLACFIEQAGANLNLFHENHMEEITKEMDGEDWKQTTVSSDIQDYVNFIMSGNLNGVKQPTTTRRTISINGQELRAVKSMIIVLKWVFGYLEFAQKFPTLVVDVLNRCLALLRFFNSNSSRLILNAKARDLGIVPTINAKHLCLVAQCLSTIILMIPQISHFFGTVMTPQQHVMLQELDNLQEDYYKHREDIYNKFVAMVGDVLEKGLQEAFVDKSWINDPKKVSPSPYIVKVVETSMQLQKALSANLSESEVLEVFSRLMVVFTDKLPAYFSSVDPKNVSTGGKTKVIGDVTHLITKVREVGPLANKGYDLERHFRSRYGN